MQIHEEVKNLKNKEDFIKFLGLLIDDYHNNTQEWEGKDVSGY